MDKEQIGFRPPSYGKVDLSQLPTDPYQQQLYPISMDDVKAALGVKKKVVNPVYTGLAFVLVFAGLAVVGHDLFGLFPLCVGWAILGYEVGRSEQ